MPFDAIANGVRGAFVGNAQPPDTYRNALDSVAALRPEGAYTGDIAMHANNFRNLARLGGGVAGGSVAPFLELAGFANEGLDAVRGMVSPGQQTGFDPTDLVANRVGIQQGLEDAGVKTLEDRLAPGVALLQRALRKVLR